MTADQQFHRKQDRGFTLLEMGIVLLIVATIVGGGLVIFSTSLDRSRYVETQEKMRVLQQALLDYRRAFDRLPCPANIATPMNTAQFGAENGNPGTCHGTNNKYLGNQDIYGNYVVDWGMVPTKALRLPDEAAIDGWGRRIEYSTHILLTRNTEPLPYTQSPLNNSMRFIGIDTTTQGNWWPTMVPYGNEGHITSGHQTSIPSYVTTTYPSGFPVYNWGDNNQQRGLRRYGQLTNRLAQCWYLDDVNSTMNIDLTITDGRPHYVSLYLLDWDNYGSGRNQRMRLIDRDTSQVLDSRVLDSYQNGVYVTYLVSGNPRIEVKNMKSTSNAVVSGIFFSMAHPAITVQDISDQTLTNRAHYVLVSHGENGHGATPRNGGLTRISANSQNAFEMDNCNCQITADDGDMDTSFTQGMPVISDSTPDQNFDDIVVFATREQLLKANE